MLRITQSSAYRLTALIGALAIGLGAFGAHGLEPMLTANNRLDTWNTATLYHLTHAIVLLVLVNSHCWRPLAWTCFATGLLIFSGTLYILSLTNLSWLGAITPIGGLLLIIAWILLLPKSR